MKNRVLATALIFLTAVFVAGAFLAPAALADWDKEDLHKMHFPQLPDEDGWDINATYPKVLADDWQCSETGYIAAIHFWGSWMNDKVGNITSFHLSVHDNIKDGPDGHSMPGNLLWQYNVDIDNVDVIRIDPDTMEDWYDPNTGKYELSNHQIYFQYNIFLNEFLPEEKWIEQEKGEIYWLDISAHVEERDCFWGWKTADVGLYPAPYTDSHFMDDAVWGDFPNVQTWHELTDPQEQETSLDLAFVVAPLPELPTIALFCVGLVGIGGYLGLRKVRQGKRELS